MAEYVERETAYKTLTDYYHHTTETMHEALREALNRIPAADVAPVRHGVWVPSPCPGIGNGYLVVCSKCGLEIYISNDYKPTNYCPNCGARMDGGEGNGKEDRSD